MAEREALLLVRLDGVGDAALCIPALEGLRRAFPQATFGAVCSRSNAEMFSDRMERVFVYDPARPLEEMAGALRAGGYTRALIATEEVAGYRIGRMSGAPLRAGFWHRLHKPFKSLWQRSQLTAPVYRPAARAAAPEHEVKTIYRLAVALGASEPVPSDPAALRRWLRIEPTQASSDARGGIGFQITPKLMTGGWRPSTVAGIIAGVLSSFPGKKAVLLASSTDEGLACAVMEHASRAGLTERLILLSSLSLPQWLGALDAVDVLVTPDTGAAHVAGILGDRVLDIFEEHDYEALSSQWHPWAGSWRSHAKPRPDMQWDAAAYGRFIAAEIRSLPST